jgi:4-amino-4-deoxy-L-arabinose transferase-like glycosyltransferase
VVANLNRSENPVWRHHLCSLLPILGVYLILAFYGIDRQSLWEDEVSSIARVAAPIPFWRDGHGFLYFALLRLWVEIGTSEVVLRSLSVWLGAAAVCLIYAIGSRLLNRRAAVIGTALFATSPCLIWYSQEARYVTLMLLTTMLTMYAFHRLMAHRRFGWWLAYGSTALLALFSFLSTLLLPLVQGLYLLVSPSRRPLLRKWLACQVVVFSLFAWWFVNGTHFWQTFMQASESSQQTLLNNSEMFPFRGEWNNVRPEVIPYTFFVLSAGFSFGPSPRELYADRTLAPLVPYAPMLFSLSVLYSAILVSAVLAFRQQRDSGILLTLWLVVPILGVFGIAKLLNFFYDVRYVAMVFPAYMLLLAAGIARFRRPGVQILLLGAVLSVHGLALANYYFDPRYAREDTRAAARFLASVAQPRDVVLVVGTVSSLPYYYKGNLPLVDFGMVDGADDPTGERLREIGANHERLWLVQIRPWQADRMGTVKAALDRAYGIIRQQHFPGVDIYAYQIAQ